MNNLSKDENAALALIVSNVEAVVGLLGDNLQAQAKRSPIQVEGVGFISIERIKETHEIFLKNYKKGVNEKMGIEEEPKKEEKFDPIINPNAGETGNAFVNEHTPKPKSDTYDDEA